MFNGVFCFELLKIVIHQTVVNHPYHTEDYTLKDETKGQIWT
ncbi:hypothetical protein SEHO0A_01976 [Salmonella enterica subsp. houtenae str. ATCC BAA-1581]|nr:hypothetical protein SEHO0A_01976 [Salmonella enterica subsp. houtenae str. ATCC BAA-1581]